MCIFDRVGFISKQYRGLESWAMYVIKRVLVRVYFWYKDEDEAKRGHHRGSRGLEEQAGERNVNENANE